MLPLLPKKSITACLISAFATSRAHQTQNRSQKFLTFDIKLKYKKADWLKSIQHLSKTWLITLLLSFSAEAKE